MRKPARFRFVRTITGSTPQQKRFYHQRTDNASNTVVNVVITITRHRVLWLFITAVYGTARTRIVTKTATSLACDPGCMAPVFFNTTSGMLVYKKRKAVKPSE